MKRPQRFDYIKTAGRIALHWNILEVAYHELFWHYLRLDQPTLAAILNRMGENQKLDLFDFLIETKESSELVRGHLFHLKKMFTRISENRNIVQHGLPANLVAVNGIVKSFGRYDGKIHKRNKLGKIVPYKASKSDLLQTLSSMEVFLTYLDAVVGPMHWPKKQRINAYALLDKPPLPPQLIPHPIPACPKAD